VLGGTRRSIPNDLAAATKSNPPALSRLLKFLGIVGIFSEDSTGKYQQTPLSDTLRRDHPQSVRNVQTCKHLQTNPFVYLRDVIERVSTHPARLVLELTPRKWTRLRKNSAARAAA
jgi:hypothetical protein